MTTDEEINHQIEVARNIGDIKRVDILRELRETRAALSGWYDVAVSMLSELRMDYAPDTLKNTDGAQAVKKLRNRAERAEAALERARALEAKWRTLSEQTSTLFVHLGPAADELAAALGEVSRPAPEKGVGAMERGTIYCSCGSEALAITPLDGGEIELAIFCWRGAGAVGWRERLRHIWRVLTVGYLYHDDIVLSRNDAERLGNLLVTKPAPAGGEARE